MEGTEQPRKRRRWPWVVGGVALAVLGLPALGIGLVLYKSTDGRWERCDTEGRDVRSITVGPHLYVAANGLGSGDVLVSDDRCLHFKPMGLITESVWDVSWLPQARQFCAGTRGGLFCERAEEGAHFAGPLTTDDIYFVAEGPHSVIAGGYPFLYAGPSVDQLKPLGKLGYAASSAAVTEDGIYVTGDALRVSHDDGQTFGPIAEAPARVRAVAALGKRIYVGGGEMGGFLARSDDGGRGWKHLDLPSSQPEELIIPGRDPDIVLLGTHGDLRRGDLYLSRDGGVTWRALGCPGAEIHGVALDQVYLYCGATSIFGKRGMWRIRLSDLDLSAPGPS